MVVILLQSLATVLRTSRIEALLVEERTVKKTHYNGITAVMIELREFSRDDLKPATTSLRCLTVEQQALIALKVLASRSFQSSAKVNINVVLRNCTSPSNFPLSSVIR